MHRLWGSPVIHQGQLIRGNSSDWRLAIARALVTKHKLLILDELTEGIQPSIIKVIGRVGQSHGCWPCQAAGVNSSF